MEEFGKAQAEWMPMAALGHMSDDIGKAIDLQTNTGLAAKRQP